MDVMLEFRTGHRSRRPCRAACRRQERPAPRRLRRAGRGEPGDQMGSLSTAAAQDSAALPLLHRGAPRGRDAHPSATRGATVPCQRRVPTSQDETSGPPPGGHRRMTPNLEGTSVHLKLSTCLSAWLNQNLCVFPSHSLHTVQIIN